MNRNHAMLARCGAIGFASLLGASLVLAAPALEQEPTLTTADFAGLPPAKGAGYSIDSRVPVTGFHGQFTLKTDHGPVVADGIGMLRQRIDEVGPSAELAKLSTSEVFVDALGDSAKRSAAAVGRAVTSPVETMKGIPAGVGRFFKSAGQTASGASAGEATETAKDALGVNKAKRRIAQQVGVDPYTTNPVVAKRLDELATAAFAGGVSLDVALAVTTAGVATALSATKTISNLAWELPPEDVRARNDRALAALGVSAGSRAALLGNRWYTPTVALAFVDAATTLGKKPGMDAFAALAAKSESETEARFYVTQLLLANAYAAAGDAVASIETPGQVGVFRTASGKVFVPAALDYVAWTADVDRFAQRPHAGASGKVIWLTGRASEAARAGLAQHGWTLREGAPLN